MSKLYMRVLIEDGLIKYLDDGWKIVHVDLDNPSGALSNHNWTGVLLEKEVI